MTTRRSLLRLVGFFAVVGAVYGGVELLRRASEPGLIFEPLAGVPGFRRIADGPISGGVTAFVGIGNASGEQTDSLTIRDGSLCDALFGQARDTNRIQIAYFTDYRCLFCRQFSPMLAKLATRGDIQISWHDLPLLGEVSTIAARAAVAARAQNAYDVFHQRLMGIPVLPTPSYLRQLSDDAGIDATKLLQDMKSPETRRQLQISAALARRFGFIGTPALVVGRTAVLGGVDKRLVNRLIEAEKNAPQPGIC